MAFTWNGRESYVVFWCQSFVITRNVFFDGCVQNHSSDFVLGTHNGDVAFVLCLGCNNNNKKNFDVGASNLTWRPMESTKETLLSIPDVVSSVWTPPPPPIDSAWLYAYLVSLSCPRASVVGVPCTSGMSPMMHTQPASDAWLLLWSQWGRSTVSFKLKLGTHFLDKDPAATSCQALWPPNCQSLQSVADNFEELRANKVKQSASLYCLSFWKAGVKEESINSKPSQISIFKNILQTTCWKFQLGGRHVRLIGDLDRFGSYRGDIAVECCRVLYRLLEIANKLEKQSQQNWTVRQIFQWKYNKFTQVKPRVISFKWWVWQYLSSGIWVPLQDELSSGWSPVPCSIIIKEV